VNADRITEQARIFVENISNAESAAQLEVIAAADLGGEPDLHPRRRRRARYLMRWISCRTFDVKGIAASVYEMKVSGIISGVHCHQRDRDDQNRQRTA